MSITKDEIKTVLDALYEKTDGDAGSSNPGEIAYMVRDGEYDDILNGLKFEDEDFFGGEGKGDYCHVVLKVTKDKESKFIKFDGYYSSYDGSTYDNGFYFCEPYEKTVRDWRKVK